MPTRRIATLASSPQCCDTGELVSLSPRDLFDEDGDRLLPPPRQSVRNEGRDRPIGTAVTIAYAVGKKSVVLIARSGVLTARSSDWLDGDRRHPSPRPSVRNEGRDRPIGTAVTIAYAVGKKSVVLIARSGVLTARSGVLTARSSDWLDGDRRHPSPRPSVRNEGRDRPIGTAVTIAYAVGKKSVVLIARSGVLTARSSDWLDGDRRHPSPRPSVRNEGRDRPIGTAVTIAYAVGKKSVVLIARSGVLTARSSDWLDGDRRHPWPRQSVRN